MGDVLHGDCLEVLKGIEDNSVHGIVTDPPYELGFMGKKWDNTGIAYNVEMWKECFRVLKPGGHLLSFGGSRTYHRMAVAIEDAGFEIRDQIMWVYGSGFPKSLNVGKAVDKMLGNEREVVGLKQYTSPDIRAGNLMNSQGKDRLQRYDDKGTSDFEGYGTGLKPAHEPIVLARKPISEKSIAENVLKWGTGGLNIDGCRVGVGREQGQSQGQSQVPDRDSSNLNYYPETLGRFPANFIHDGSDEVLTLFPMTKSGFMSKGTKRLMSDNPNKNTYGEWKPDEVETDTFGDSGSAARFFYCAKASKSERNAGLEGMEEKHFQMRPFAEDGCDQSVLKNRMNSKAGKNHHPTVKPIKLMRYLIKLIIPKGGILLDPFAGSGTTGCAAELEGVDYILIEREEEYIPIIQGRTAFYGR